MESFMLSSPEVYQAQKQVWEAACKVHQGYLSAFQRGHGKDTVNGKLAISFLVTPGLYRHWKSTEHDPKFYIVFGCGVEKDTYVPLVSYASLYGDYAGMLGFLDMLDATRGFLAPVNRPDGPPFPHLGQRFRQVISFSLMDGGRILHSAKEIALQSRSEDELVSLVQRSLGGSLR